MRFSAVASEFRQHGTGRRRGRFRIPARRRAGSGSPAQAFRAAPRGPPSALCPPSATVAPPSATAAVRSRVRHRPGSARRAAPDAGSIELTTGLPVMAMGGFTGSDPVPTLAQLQGYVASGQLRYVIAGGMGGRFSGPGGADSVSGERTAWVTSACRAVDYGGSGSSTLYDCAGAVSKPAPVRDALRRPNVSPRSPRRPGSRPSTRLRSAPRAC